MLQPDPFLLNLGKVLNRYPNYNWQDALSKGQLESKYWVIGELNNLKINMGTIYVLAGWIGTLSALIFKEGTFSFSKIRSFDIDPECAPIADTLNKDPYVMVGWKFKASTCDIHSLDYKNGNMYQTLRGDGTPIEAFTKPSSIINTSCEHISDFSTWWDKIPKGMLCVLQSNDYFELPEHINCVENLDEFKSQLQMTNILYSGELPTEKYNRFMVIGYK